MKRIENISIGIRRFASRQIVFDQVFDRGFRLKSRTSRCFDVRS